LIDNHAERQAKGNRAGGNIAERRAREYCERKGIGFGQFGFNELGDPSSSIFPVWKISSTLRAAPDFIIYPPSGRWNWLEAKGFARHNGNGFRLHAKKIPLYEHWQKWYPVLLFIHDIDERVDYIVSLDSLSKHIADTAMSPSGYYDRATMGKKKPYFEFFEEVLEPLNMANAYQDRAV
jgi:hypothetical protein